LCSSPKNKNARVILSEDARQEHCRQIAGDASGLDPVSLHTSPSGTGPQQRAFTMRVAIEVNVALWGMIFCAVQVAHQFI
jgi:hypothetical protein